MLQKRYDHTCRYRRKCHEQNDATCTHYRSISASLSSGLATALFRELRSGLLTYIIINLVVSRRIRSDCKAALNLEDRKSNDHNPHFDQSQQLEPVCLSLLSVSCRIAPCLCSAASTKATDAQIGRYVQDHVWSYANEGFHCRKRLHFAKSPHVVNVA